MIGFYDLGSEFWGVMKVSSFFNSISGIRVSINTKDLVSSLIFMA